MEGRGQGEAVIPPPVVPRRRISKSRHLSENDATITNPGNHVVTQLPSTIHISSIGVEGDVDADITARTRTGMSSFKSKLTKAIYVGIGLVVVFTSVGLVLDYYDIWDPCSVKIPFQTHCTVDTYVGGLLQRAEFTEDSLCLVPGVFHTTQNSGWNVDCSQSQDININFVADQPMQT